MPKALTEKQFEPNERQQAFIEALLDGKPTKEAAIVANTPLRTVYGWLERGDFKDFLIKQRQKLRAVTLPAIDGAMAKEAIKGNTSAARLVYELAGEVGQKTENTAITVVFTKEWNEIKDPINDKQVIDVTPEKIELGGV